MTSPGYYNVGKRLTEGKRYYFQVISETILQDDSKYYILEDPYKIRHLLNSGPYMNYNIEIGQVIRCKVDKINCTGRIYLEPDHPYYKEGQIYKFIFSSIRKKARSEKLTAIVFDIFNNEISVDCPGYFKFKSGEVACRITHLRKGKPMLVLDKDHIEWDLSE